MQAYPAKKIIFVFFWIVTAGIGFAVAAQDSNESENNLFNDFDQDGLTNDEESQYKTDPYKLDTDGDGYSDYTEITTGYNPLKPAPGDKVVNDASSGDRGANTSDVSEEGKTQNAGTVVDETGTFSESFSNSDALDVSQTDNETANLTNQVSDRLNALLTSQDSGDGSQDGVNVEGEINAIIQEIIQENTKEIVLPEVDEASIIVKKQNYDNLPEEEKKQKIQKDTEEYVTAVAYILAANSPEKIDSNEDVMATLEKVANNSIDSFLSGGLGYVDDISEKGEKIMEQMEGVEVPENMLKSHKQGLQFAQYASGIKDVTKPMGSDPIRDIINLSQTQGFMQMFSFYAGSVFSNLREAGITSGMSLSL